MAVYRIFPEKDSFIWSEPNIISRYGNAGKDEVLELGTYLDSTRTSRTSRILTKFRTSDIVDTIDNIVGLSFSSSLRMYLADASQIPQDFSIYSYPVSGTWDPGIGKRDDNPYNYNGVSWEYRDGYEGEAWNNLGGDYFTEYETSQSFDTNSTLDVNLDVTEAVNLFYSGTLENSGFILKLDESLETASFENFKLSYFGADTNSVYSPVLEFKWDDSVYSSSLSELDTDIASITVNNLRGKYSDDGKVRFRITAKPKYPQRTFTTSSVYLTNYKLPLNSYWAIKDTYANEVIIDFDENFTKVSADDRGSYFDIYMNSFYPERYYTILLKTTLDGSEIVYDEKITFKVV